ncbi:hypothetical protein IFM89_030285 [Coptis chinensis]|uniref:Uncharacterized protein n=1 Tax=Coptis chinensis TaxID=261450 RepID=A0A835IVA8_9MAGN|nr:hypothetical protein IFM89_030285 [Coptis chinensis]
MVSRFRRTLSFPKPSITPRPTSYHHVRSVSLPCRSHPLFSQLNDEINDLKSWISEERNSSWICQGFIRLKNLHDSFNDLLQLPKTQESLHRRSDYIEKLLDEFLQFIDVFDDVELAGIIRDVNEVTVSVTTLMLNGISGSSTKSKACINSGLNFMNKKSSKCEERIQEFEEVEGQKLISLRKQGDNDVKNLLKKFENLEKCVVEMESESGKMFRSLINTRVSLLNILTL